uniref:Nicalin n=1 Tax=Plectus sambesii TaxID=2011161 RepID=A0A914X155_9BILA
MAICLDSLAKGSALRMHVSKVPTDTAPANRFLAHLRRATTVRFGANRSVDVVAKKINLGADFLSWEHERFNIRRLAALTLSHFESPTDPMRRSLLDTPGQVDLDALTANVQVIAEALLRHIYDLPDGASTSSDNSAAIFLDDTAGVQKDRLQSWIERLTSSARASQIVVETGKKNPLLADFLSTFDHYAHEAQLVPVNVDKKDPEFVLYGAVDDRLAAYRVKPAVFELVLATLIAAYLGLVYFAVLNAQSVLQYVQCHAIKYKTS